MAQVIAVVSADAAYRELMREVCTGEGYRTILWSEGQSAHEMILRERPDLVLLDAWIEHPDAGEMVLALLRHTPETRATPVLLCATDHHVLHEKADMLAHARCGVLLKPFDLDEALGKIKTTLAAAADSGYRERSAAL